MDWEPVLASFSRGISELISRVQANNVSIFEGSTYDFDLRSFGSVICKVLRINKLW